jgi:hypothetical protein
MGFLFVENCMNLPFAQIAIGLGALAIGLIPMAYYWANGSDYYRAGAVRLDATAADEVDALYGESMLTAAGTGSSGGGLATDL